MCSQSPASQHSISSDVSWHTLLNGHSNWFYDVSGLMTPHPFNPKNPQQPPVNYAEHMTLNHVRVHAEEAFATWEPIFRNAPERIVLGFDMGQTWNLDAFVLDSWVQTFRSVLGYLPEELAANIAHRNAERMLSLGE